MILANEGFIFPFSCISIFGVMMSYSWSVVALEIVFDLSMRERLRDLF